MHGDDGEGWPTALVYSVCVHIWYWTSVLWSNDTCQDKVTAEQWSRQYRRLKFRGHQGHVFFWSWVLPICWFSIGSQAQARLTYWNGALILGLISYLMRLYASIEKFQGNLWLLTDWPSDRPTNKATAWLTKRLTEEVEDVQQVIWKVDCETDIPLSVCLMFCRSTVTWRKSFKKTGDTCKDHPPQHTQLVKW